MLWQHSAVCGQVKELSSGCSCWHAHVIDKSYSGEQCAHLSKPARKPAEAHTDAMLLLNSFPSTASVHRDHPGPHRPGCQRAQAPSLAFRSRHSPSHLRLPAQHWQCKNDLLKHRRKRHRTSCYQGNGADTDTGMWHAASTAANLSLVQTAIMTPILLVHSSGKLSDHRLWASRIYVSHIRCQSKPESTGVRGVPSGRSAGRPADDHHR